MIAPQPVHTRKIALVAEYGFGPERVPIDYFDDDYFTVIGKVDRPDLRIHYAPIASGERLMTRVYWKPEDRQRAREARLRDWHETIGTEATAQLSAAIALLDTRAEAPTV